MNVFFALFSRLIGLGLFLVGGVVVLSKIFGNSKNIDALSNGKKADELDEFLNPSRNNSIERQKEAAKTRSRFDAEIHAAKQRAKEREKRFKRIDWAWKIGSLGSGLLAAGLAIEIFENPIGPIGLGILVAAIVGWLGAIINNYFNEKALHSSAIAVPPRETISAPKLGENALPAGRSELVNSVLAEAATALNHIEEIMPRLRHTDSIAAVAQIVTLGKRLMASIAANPEKFATAQRVFTYYCPQTQNLAEALAILENDPKPDFERISSTQKILQKLVELFDKTEQELKADDNKSLDIDLKLLDQSLQADLTSI